MSVHLTSKKNNSRIYEIQENEVNKSDGKFNKSQNENDINNSKNLNYSKTVNNSSILYPYPICLHNEKDPIDDYRLRIIKARNKGSDTFLKNYLKFNFAKNDINNNQLNNNNNSNLKENILENNKSSLFITENKRNNILQKSSKGPDDIIPKAKGVDVFNEKRRLFKSKSDLFNPYSQKSINNYKKVYLMEMEKRGNQYNKRRLASLQRIALHNFSSINLNGGHFVNGSIPSGKNDESYILETKKRKKLPGIREYICYRLKKNRENEVNTPEFYLEKYKKLEKNKLPEMIDIKNSGLFKFHVFHDQYGFRKEMDKRENRGLKMTKDRIRDFKIMAKINRINDPYIADIYKRALYNE